MKKVINLVAVLVAATTLANAQWTRNAGTKQTYTTFIEDSVGIGTTNPKFKLDVQATGVATLSFKSATDNASILLDRGASNKTSSITYRTGGVNNWQTGCVSNNNFTIRNNSLAQVALFCDYATNNIGIGTTTPSNKLSVTGNVDFNGNVGIGTTNPYSQLAVSTGSIANTRGIWSGQFSNSNFAAVFGGRKARGTEAVPLVVAASDYTMGVCAQNFDGTNYINNGSIGYRVTGAVTPGNVPGEWYFGATNNNDVDPYFNGTVRMVVQNTGNVGIGTTTPTQKLEVNGTVYSTSGGFKFPDGTTQTTAAVANTFANLSLSNLTVTSINQTLKPNTNNSKDIGTSALAWKDIYMSGKIYLGANPFIKNTGGICIGSMAGNASTGNFNIFLGNNSGVNNSTGASNIFVGYDVSSSSTTGNNNTFIGDFCGINNTSGSNNTLVGSGTQVSSGALTNATAIGSGATVNQSNSLILGNNANVGIGTSTPETRFHIKSNSSMPYPQVLISEDGNDFARLSFNNTNSTSYWSILGYNNATNASERLNFYNSTSGYVMSLTGNGNVGIGTNTPSYKLDVCGAIRAKEVRVETGWCDYVFANDYKLRPLSEVEAFINTNKHLPDVTAGPVIESEGLEVGKVSAQMIRKIEELTLYVIELQKQVDTLKASQK